MTQENKSAADVAVTALFYNLNDRAGYDTGDIDEEIIAEWKAEWAEIVTQSIHAEAKALAAELVELKAEIGRLREGLRKAHEALDMLEDGCDFGPCPHEIIKNTLSQPTPTGSGERFLRLAAAAYQFHIHLEDCQVVIGDDHEFRQAARCLIPEDIKILEGYRDE